MKSIQTKMLPVYALVSLMILTTLWAFVVVREQNIESHNAWIDSHRKLGRSTLIVQAARNKVTNMPAPDFAEMNEYLEIINEQITQLTNLQHEANSSLAKLAVDPTEATDEASRFLKIMSQFKDQLTLTRESERLAVNAIQNLLSEGEPLTAENEIHVTRLLLAVEKLDKFGQEDLLINLDERIANAEKHLAKAISFTNEPQRSQIDSEIAAFLSSLKDLRNTTNQVLTSEETIRQAALNLFYAIDSAAAASIPRVNILFNLLIAELIALAVIFVFISHRLKKKLIYHNNELENLVKSRTKAMEMAMEDLTTSMENQKKIEEELRLAQRLEAIGQLAAGIAHEINTPSQFVNDNLQFILEAHTDLAKVRSSYAESVKQLASSTGDEKILEDMQNLEDEVDLEFLEEEVPSALKNSLDGMERISKIVKSMKDFSHPGTDGRKPADINKAIETTLSVARNEWKYSANIEKDFAEDLPKAPVFASELNQVLLNIIVNAAQAIEEKNAESESTDMGSIWLKTEYDQDYVDLRVRDSGCGIPQKNIDRVFDPFFTTKEVGKGTGQGLSIARKVVVDQHGGILKVTSETGQFTEFHIRLPRSVENDKVSDNEETSLTHKNL